MSSKCLTEFILSSAPSNVTTGFSGRSRPQIEQKNERLLLLLLLSLFMCLFGFAKRRLIPHSLPEGSDMMLPVETNGACVPKVKSCLAMCLGAWTSSLWSDSLLSVRETGAWPPTHSSADFFALDN